MIGLPAGTPIYLCTTPVDFRKGFDGLTGIVTQSFGHNVTDGRCSVRQPQAGSHQGTVVGNRLADDVVSSARRASP